MGNPNAVLTEEIELKTIKTLHKKKVPIKKIAKSIKSTQAYVIEILVREGLRVPRAGKMISWKTKEEHIYNQLVQNFTYGQIAERMGVPNPSNKAQRMSSDEKKVALRKHFDKMLQVARKALDKK